MPDNDGWLKVCAQAAVEQDPAKLIKLIRELNDLLEARRGLPPRVSLSQLQNDSTSARGMKQKSGPGRESRPGCAHGLERA